MNSLRDAVNGINGWTEDTPTTALTLVQENWLQSRTIIRLRLCLEDLVCTAVTEGYWHHKRCACGWCEALKTAKEELKGAKA
jgi:hypothetical protein